MRPRGLPGEEGAKVGEGGADVAAKVEDAVGTCDTVAGAAFCDEAYKCHGFFPALSCGRVVGRIGFDSRTDAGSGM